MDDILAGRTARAADLMRRQARAFTGPTGRDALPWAVIEPFDAEIRGALGRDRRIEEERDRVLIMAVKLAETPPEETEEVSAARVRLVDAIDYLEQAVLRFGIAGRPRR